MALPADLAGWTEQDTGLQGHLSRALAVSLINLYVINSKFMVKFRWLQVYGFEEASSAFGGLSLRKCFRAVSGPFMTAGRARAASLQLISSFELWALEPFSLWPRASITYSQLTRDLRQALIGALHVSLMRC